MGEWLDDFVRRRENHLRASNRLPYALTLKKHIKVANRFIGSVKLSELRKRDLDDLWVQLATVGKKGKPYSRKYVANIRGTLRLALDDAVANEYIASNPVMVSKPDREPEAADAQNEPPEAYTRGQWKSIIDWLVEHLDIVDTVPVLIAAYTGCRRGEALGLTWDDVDFEAGTITFRNQMVRSEGETVMRPLKSRAARRTIAPPPELLDLLAKHRRVSGLARLDRLVCVDAHGREMHPEMLTHFVRRKVYETLGLPKLGLHGLRHTIATMLLLDGVPDVAVAQYLGDADANVTRRIYAHVLADNISDAGAAITRLAAT